MPSIPALYRSTLFTMSLDVDCLGYLKCTIFVFRNIMELRLYCCLNFAFLCREAAVGCRSFSVIYGTNGKQSAIKR